MQFNRRRKQRSEKEAEKRELHELPYTEIVKSATIRLVLGLVAGPCVFIFNMYYCRDLFLPAVAGLLVLNLVISNGYAFKHCFPEYLAVP